MPTTAAVISCDAAGEFSDMHAPLFQGKPDVPRLLQWTTGGSPVYVADGTLYSLEDDEKPRGSWTVRLPPKATFERLASGPGPLLSIDWSADGRRHHSVVDPRNGSISHDDLPIDARTIPAYFQLGDDRAVARRADPAAAPRPCRVGLCGERGLADRRGRRFVPAPGGDGVWHARDSGRPRHLIEVNMERVARAVYPGQSPPTVPRRSDKK